MPRLSPRRLPAQNPRMPSIVRHRLLIAAMLPVAIAAADIARADDVTIYRCVDAGGKVSLQDRPCPKDVHQDVRQMLRPQDPPPGPQSIATTQPPPAARPNGNRDVVLRVIHVRDPQPLFECRTVDGDTYLSQTGIPESRYVPVWTLGLGDGFVNVGGRVRPEPQRGSGRLPPGSFGYPPVTYTEDTCVRLPQDEICQRMRVRNDELGTRIFNGQPSDRERFERERKGLLEQIAQECTGY